MRCGRLPTSSEGEPARWALEPAASPTALKCSSRPWRCSASSTFDESRSGPGSSRRAGWVAAGCVAGGLPRRTKKTPSGSAGTHQQVLVDRLVGQGCGGVAFEQLHDPRKHAPGAGVTENQEVVVQGQADVVGQLVDRRGPGRGPRPSWPVADQSPRVAGGSAQHDRILGAPQPIAHERHPPREERPDRLVGRHVDGLFDAPTPLRGFVRAGGLPGELGQGEPDLRLGERDEQVGPAAQLQVEPHVPGHVAGERLITPGGGGQSRAHQGDDRQSV